MFEACLEVILHLGDYPQPQMDLIRSLEARIHVEDLLEGRCGQLECVILKVN